MKNENGDATHDFFYDLRSKSRGNTSPEMKRFNTQPKVQPINQSTGVYPLVIADIAIENVHRNSGFTRKKW